MRPLSFRRSLRHDAGFSLLDQLATLVVLGTLSGMAVPLVTNAFENQRLGIDVRNVERELQMAKMTAVAVNQPIRFRFNCPTTGSYRRVELLGTVNAPATDDADTKATVRCNYGAPDTNPLTRPNQDGPTRQLYSKVSFTAVQTLEFWPDGTVHSPGSLTALATSATLTLTQSTKTRSITVNSLGKITIQ